MSVLLWSEASCLATVAASTLGFGGVLVNILISNFVFNFSNSRASHLLMIILRR
jgi:hypothetical protein